MTKEEIHNFFKEHNSDKKFVTIFLNGGHFIAMSNFRYKINNSSCEIVIIANNKEFKHLIDLKNIVYIKIEDPECTEQII